MDFLPLPHNILEIKRQYSDLCLIQLTERMFMQESDFVKYGTFRNVFKCVFIYKTSKAIQM